LIWRHLVRREREKRGKSATAVAIPADSGVCDGGRNAGGKERWCFHWLCQSEWRRKGMAALLCLPARKTYICEVQGIMGPLLGWASFPFSVLLFSFFRFFSMLLFSSMVWHRLALPYHS
jgi:hypothetical protein